MIARFSRTPLIAALLTTSAIYASPALAAGQIDVNIPAQSLETALNALSRQMGEQIFFPSASIAGIKSSALVGRMSRQDAVRRLIRNSGLAVRSDDGKTVILGKSAPEPGRQAEPEPETGTKPNPEIVVLGTGQSRQMQTLDRSALAKDTPGTSPLQSLGKLPGVDFESSDPLGTYEWAQQISIRGFTTDQMGYTLDGVPLGNMQYRNNDGLSIGRALITENNGPVTLSQGSGALGTASTSNIGGTIDFTSVAPTRDFGIDLSQTFGSSNTWRTFARLNSGVLPTGGRFMISYAHQNTGKWKGWGKQKQDQINAKLVQPIGSGVTSTTYLDLQSHKEDDYPDVSLDLVNRLGWKTDNIKSWALAEELARDYQNGTAVPAPYESASDTIYDEGGIRRDMLLYEKLDYDLSSRLSGQTTGYWHLDHGMGTYADIYDPTPAADGGSPLSNNALSYRMNRKGVISRLAFQAGSNKIEAGFWYENNSLAENYALYGYQEGVTPSDFQRFYHNPYETLWNYTYHTQTYQFDLGDTWQVNDALRINAGFKSLISRNTVHTITSSNPINGSIKASNGFLPTVGVLYKLAAHHEVFADYTRNMAGYVAQAADGPFSTTQSGFDYIRGRLKPETTDTVEGGYRYHDGALQASLTGYYVHFKNRLLESSISAIIVGNQNVLENVGGVTSRGVEGAVSWRFAPSWSLYASASYNDATYDDNVSVPGEAVVPIKGNQVVASPRNVDSLQLAYDNGRFWGQLSGHYHSKRYYTYENDVPIAGAATVDLAAGYRIGGTREQPRIELLLNITNLFNKRYYASLGTSGFTNSDPTGTYTTLQVAAPRQVFGTIRTHF